VWGVGVGPAWVVRERVGARGEMTQALYAHMNNKKNELYETHPTFNVYKPILPKVGYYSECERLSRLTLRCPFSFALVLTCKLPNLFYKPGQISASLTEQV
jgi:hypothetical protein